MVKIKLNDQLLIIGETSGLVEMTPRKMIINKKTSRTAKKGEEATFITPELVRRNDKVYIIEPLD